MSLKVKLKEIIAPSVIGAVMTILIVILLQSYLSSLELTEQQAALLGQTLGINYETLGLLIIFAFFLSFIVGGFVSGYFACKDKKIRLGHAVLAAFFSGIIAEIVLFIILFATLPQLQRLTDLEAFLLVTELGFIAILGAIMATSLSSLGGIISAFVLGFGKSQLANIFSDAYKIFKQNFQAFLPAFIFFLITFGIAFILQNYVQETGIALTIIGYLASFLLFAFAYTCIIMTISKKMHSFKKCFQASIYKSKNVIILLFLATIPAVLAIVGVSLSPFLLTPNTALALFIFIFEILVIVYLIFISFIPQSALLSKGNLKQRFIECIYFVKENFLGVISFYMIVLVISFVLEIPIIIIDTITFGLGYDIGFILDGLYTALILTFIGITQTKFYLALR